MRYRLPPGHDRQPDPTAHRSCLSCAAILAATIYEVCDTAAVVSGEELSELQDWYVAQCDGDWEHSYGVSVATLDNPGWSVRIDLHGTTIATRTFERHEAHRTQDDWLVCRLDSGAFHVSCGPPTFAKRSACSSTGPASRRPRARSRRKRASDMRGATRVLRATSERAYEPYCGQVRGPYAQSLVSPLRFSVNSVKCPPRGSESVIVVDTGVSVPCAQFGTQL